MILVSGCSWSDSNFKTDYHPGMDHGYPKWFDYIETEEKIVSIGRCGNSNDTIISKALEMIFLDSSITKVVLALTEWSRFNLLKQEIHPALWILKDNISKKPNPTERDKVMIDHVDALITHHSKWIDYTDFKPHHYIPYIVNKTILNLTTIQEVCKSKGIELIVFQMLWPLYNKVEELGISTLIKNDLFHKMYNEPNVRFLNFPFFRKLGGECVEGLIKQRKDYENLVISDVDKHPNGNGHRVIGEWFNEQVKVL